MRMSRKRILKNSGGRGSGLTIFKSGDMCFSMGYTGSQIIIFKYRKARLTTGAPLRLGPVSLLDGLLCF